MPRRPERRQRGKEEEEESVFIRRGEREESFRGKREEKAVARSFVSDFERTRQWPGRRGQRKRKILYSATKDDEGISGNLSSQGKKERRESAKTGGAAA